MITTKQKQKKMLATKRKVENNDNKHRKQNITMTQIEHKNDNNKKSRR